MGYLLIADIWEADVVIDPQALKDGGVVGLIVRLNDMNGGHHKDELFELNWERAKQFPIQAIYFVYNPWVSGLENKRWLYNNLPWDYGNRRIFTDVEVRYAGYSKADYGKEVRWYDQNIRNPKSIYTGGGYVGLLDQWPTGSYWWARYPYLVAPPEGLRISWEELNRLVNQLPWSSADLNKLCPDKVDLWQCTDRVVLPGMNGRALDINLYPGTLEEAKKFFNVPEIPQEVQLYENFAKGIFLYEGCSIADPSSLKGKIDFVIGEVGVGIKPKPKFKEWAELAVYLNVPFIGFVGSDPEPYLAMTYNPDMWGNKDTDQTVRMIDKERKYASGVAVPVHGFIIDGSKYLTDAGKPLTDPWMNGVWKHTWSMVEKRFSVRIFPFMKWETLNNTVNPIPKDGAVITTLGNLPTVSTYRKCTEKVFTDLQNHFIPSDKEGPKQPYSAGWDFWWYGSANLPGITGGVPLFLYRGTPEDLNKKLSFVPNDGEIEPPPPPPVVETNIEEKLLEIKSALEALPSNRYVSIAITELEKLQAFVKTFIG